MKQSNRVIALVLFCVFAFGLAVPAFAVDSVNVPTVTAVNCASEITIGYKETRQFEFEAHDLPAGAAVHVFCSGEDRGETTYIYVTEPTEDYTVEAKVIDRSGGELASSGVIRVTVKNGFFDRAAAFFKRTIRTVADGVADVVGAFFVSILYFFDGLIH